MDPVRPVVVVDWTADWSVSYSEEADRLRRVLGSLIVEIHHVGSTAVAGLCAKPVIDIFLQVVSLRELDAQTSRIESMGYQAMGEYGLAGRRFFWRGSQPRTHHIHAYQADNPEPLRHVHFRDYLRCHSDIAAEYGRMKRAAAATHPRDMEAYCRAKAPFIVAHEARALAWVEQSRKRSESEPLGGMDTIYGVPLMDLRAQLEEEDRTE